MRERRRKLKVYSTNYGGRAQAVVAAHSQREACDLIGCSLSDFRAFGSETGHQESIDKAMSEPGVVFLKSYSFDGTWSRK